MSEISDIGAFFISGERENPKRLGFFCALFDFQGALYVFNEEAGLASAVVGCRQPCEILLQKLVLGGIPENQVLRNSTSCVGIFLQVVD